MATQKKTATKPAKPARPSGGKATAKASAKPARPSDGKATAKAPAKKTVPPGRQATVKVAAKAKPVAKKAPVKVAVKSQPKPVAKKAAAKVVAKKVVKAVQKTGVKKQAKNIKTVTKKTQKTVPAKNVPVKKAPAKKAPPVAKKAAPVKKIVAPVKKAAAKKPVEVKKSVVKAKPVSKESTKKPVAKPAAPVAKKATLPVKPAEAVVVKPKKVKLPKKSVVVAKTTTRTAPPAPIVRPTGSRLAREEKKPNIIIAHRRLDNKSKNADKSGKTMINYQPDYNRSILDEPINQQGPVYRYSDEELSEFKDLINHRLEAARKELLYLQGLITRKDEAGTEDTENRYMNMEDGSGAMEREQLAQLASRQIQFIGHLEKAMMRIENKTYGICRVTGKLIDKARLRAVPHATLSIEAKNTMASNK